MSAIAQQASSRHYISERKIISDLHVLFNASAAGGARVSDRAVVYSAEAFAEFFDYRKFGDMHQAIYSQELEGVQIHRGLQMGKYRFFYVSKDSSAIYCFYSAHDKFFQELMREERAMNNHYFLEECVA
ncbi:TPA: hypothetical protein ACOFDS_003266 [Stenotrophomonas maltophilia]